MATKKVKLNKKAVAQIELAIKAQDTMYKAIKEAGKLAFADIDLSLGIKQATDKMTSDYSHLWAGKDSHNNIRDNFKGTLILLAMADTPLSFEHNGKEYHTTGKDALDLAKNPFKAAVSAARDEAGFGRAKGDQRKPRVSKATAKAASDAKAASVKPKVGEISGQPLAAPTTKKAGMVNSLNSHSLKELVTELRERISGNSQAASVLMAMLKDEGYVIYKRK